MLFDRDKELNKQQLKGLPFIFPKSQFYDNQSNKSLYKNDSDSSHLTIYPDNYQLNYDKSLKYTLNLNPKNSYTSNDQHNNISIKKYLKKADQFNKLNVKKIFRIENNTEQKSNTNLLYKLPKDFSINRLEKDFQPQQKSNQKSLKKIYLSHNSKKKSNSSRLQALNANTPKRFATLSKLSRPKQIKKLVNQEVQTEKQVQRTLRPKKAKPGDNTTKNISAKLNTFDTAQKKNSQKPTNLHSRINEKDGSNKSKFINLSSILEKDEEQPQIPRKMNSIRQNNVLTKHLINQSFNGQQSTAPSTYEHSYLDSMSKLSYNFTNDVQKIKSNRYEQIQKPQRYSKTIQVIAKADQRQKTQSKPHRNMSKRSNEVFTQVQQLSNEQNNQKKQKTNQLIQRQKQQRKTHKKSALNPQDNNVHSQNISISLSIVPEQTQTVRSIDEQSLIYAEHFSALQTVNQEKDEFNLQNGQSSYAISRKMKIKSNNQHKQQSLQKVQKIDEIMQFPEVTELKVSGPVRQNDIKNPKLIHPIRNNFNEKGAQWIADKYRPKSKILQMISLDHFQIKKYRNGVYFGQLNQNKKNGYGIVFYYIGKLYEGQFQNDLKEGNGYEEFPDGSKYQGQFQQGTKNGKGVFEWINGEVYQGEWSNGKKHGSGIWKSSQGQSYIGQWKDGQVEGFGVYISKRGDRYEGEFKNSNKHGYGTQRYQNGQTYVGQYRKNRPNGQGQYFWANGNYYKGEFVNHLRHGHGYFKDKQNEESYQGQYRNDKKCGYGQLIVGEKTYAGNFQNDYKHGYGEQYQSGQCRFKGYWVNGKILEDQEQYHQQNCTKGLNKIHVITEKSEMTNVHSNARFNRMNTKNQRKIVQKVGSSSASQQKQNLKDVSKDLLSKSKSPQNKSIESAQNSLEKSNYKRACGCSRRH